MAAAYAALVSLTHIIEHIAEHHPHRPFFLGKPKRQLDSLQKKVGFLKDFLEVYSSKGNNIAQQSLEIRIAEAAYAAEDVIESHVVDSILPQTRKKQSNGEKEVTSHGESSSGLLSHGLQSLIESIDSINKEVMMIKQKTRVEDQKASDLVDVVLSKRPTTRNDIKVEYYKEDLEQIMDKLTGQSSDLQIIPIVGMGGIGKTTLTRSIYEDQLVEENFPFRAWVTVSREYNLKEIFFGLLDQFKLSTDKQQSCEYYQLGVRLHKHLSDRKYLIIIDDMWSADVWEKLKLYLPDYSNGSRVIITTRLLNVVDGFDPSYLYKMKLLDEKKSWSLLCTKVFGHDGNCPLELEEIGKDIARNCKGLPLTIVVIGGLLANSESTQKYWEYVAKDINQIVNSEDDGRCLNILYLSYSQLPIHLKPCFLYMGSFKEDSYISVSDLIKLWVAEGFLKPRKGKSLEEAAKDYLKDLIDRNLVFVRAWGSVGGMKTCGIHDLLRNLCLREARKDKFFDVVKKHAQTVGNERRRMFREGEWDRETITRYDLALYIERCGRSVSCDSECEGLSLENYVHTLRLLRVLSMTKFYSLESIPGLVNLRYLRSGFSLRQFLILPPMMCQLMYLQTLTLTGNKALVAPYEIWEMPQLRHIVVIPYILLSVDRINGQEDRVLKNLQTLKTACGLKFTEEVIARIPNIKKLSVECLKSSFPNDDQSLHNLDRLNNLQSLTCSNMGKTDFLKYLELPQSLNKLMLIKCEFDWDSLTTKVGSLPNLEKLKLSRCSVGAEWNTVEGKFLRLKFLEIEETEIEDMESYGATSCRGLECWTSESSHFPLLQHLVLSYVKRLEKIPSGIGEETLQSIKLFGCTSSVIASAKEIVEEQESNGNEDLRLTILNPNKNRFEIWEKIVHTEEEVVIMY